MSRVVSRCHILVTVLFVFCLYISHVSAIPKSAWLRQSHQRGGVWDKKSELHGSSVVARDDSAAATYADNGPNTIPAPKKNIWQGLTDQETADVVAWLFDQAELNLTVTKKAGEWDNTILLVELNQPNKSDAVAYLDADASAPPRYARVVLDQRSTVDPYFGEILVGPLPVKPKTTTWQPLTYPFTKNSGGRIRNLDADSEETLYTEWLYKISASILDITLDLWNGSALGLDNDTLDVWGIDPLWQYPDGSIIRWDTFWGYPTDVFDAETVLPQGLFFKSDITGRDPSKWTLAGWLYNDIFYETTEAFRAAYYTPGFVKLQPGVEGNWARSDQQGSVLPQDRMYPPTVVAPTGSRYAVNVNQKFVRWMDFEFYLSFAHDTGLRLFDIRYKGERIIYELGLQEALAHYAGNDPVQSGTSYLDSYYSFGRCSFELVKGYDCPAYATYLNSSFYVAEQTRTHIDNICLFESDAGYPIQRHTTDQYVSATKNIYFTVKFVSTVGNYDYSFSYEFYIDGSIHVEVRASGYIQAAYWAHNGDYGYHIQDALSGSMHDHVLNFKVDLDVLGINNTLQTTTNTPVSQVYPWSNGEARNTMKLVRSYIASEDDSRLFWAANGATQFTVVNTDAPNIYGEYPGYRILQSEGTAHLSVLNSSNLQNAANWALHDLQITQQHDTEPRCAYPYNSQEVANPMIDFNDFFNGENLLQTDLVAWINVGMHHIPNSHDLPNTVMTTAHSGFQIMPINYLASDPSRQTVNQVRINYKDGKVKTVKTFGQDEDFTCGLNFTAAEADLYGYKGDSVIRKFPYDPNDPYYDTESIV